MNRPGIAIIIALIILLHSFMSLTASKEQDEQASQENKPEEVLTEETGEPEETVHESRIEESDGPDSIFEDFRPDWQEFGDFDVMRKERTIRALVPYSLMFYSVDKGVQRGASYDMLKAFEEKMNKDLKTGNLKIDVVIIPTSRDSVIHKLINGYGDIALGNYTITEERLKLVDFSDPVYDGVKEIVVTGPDSPPISSLEDLSGQEIWVRASSSYYESLKKLNESLKKDGKEPVIIRSTDERLDDEDIMEMVSAGLINFTVIDDHLAEFWSQIIDNLEVRPDLVLRTEGKIAWMMRKDSPQLRKVVNDFIKGHKKGTEFGNILFKRYLRNTDWVDDSLEGDDRKRFESMVEIFKNYAGQYDFDWLLLAAQGYQESELDQKKRSPSGAIGVMQLLPSTAKDPKINIPDIEKLDNNVHAGTKYLRFMVNNYFDDPDIDPLDRLLFAFASYNAGPRKIAQMRKIAEERGLDPDVWFDNVEIVSSQKIGRETVTYVANIYKYYIAYEMAMQEAEKRKEVKKTQGLE
ncbi:MAG: lytic transglycosylase F [Candidatus Dadabacteria bacterium]|nr:lytic transglycosylase F [Candidatus Dadabacteria bacterium]